MREFKTGDRVRVVDRPAARTLWYKPGWTGVVLDSKDFRRTHRAVEFGPGFGEPRQFYDTNPTLRIPSTGCCRWYVDMNHLEHAGPIDYTSVDEGGVV